MRDGWFVAASAIGLLVAGVLTFQLATGALALARTAAPSVETLRWEAKADFYEAQAAQRARAQAADAARWNGLAGHYAELAAKEERALEAENARWKEMGEFYARQAAAHQRALDADTARWVAMGDYYREQAEAARRSEVGYAAHYTGQAILAFTLTGDPDLLPNCASAELLAQLPSIGDDGWRATIPACGE
jgi:hypothetical protein